MSLVASVASIPERERGLRIVVDAVLPQVDRLCVFLHGYPNAPEWLNREQITVVRSQDVGDPGGPAGKHYWSADWPNAYHLTLDDDLHYPPDYVAKMVAAAKRCGGMAGVHGRRLASGVSYFRPTWTCHYSSALAADTRAHVIGTGTLCHHGSLGLTRDVAWGWMTDDPVLGVWAEKRGIPRVLVARPEGWLRSIAGVCSMQDVFTATKIDAAIQERANALVQTVSWGALPVIASSPVLPVKATAKGMRQISPGMLVATGGKRRR